MLYALSLFVTLLVYLGDMIGIIAGHWSDGKWHDNIACVLFITPRLHAVEQGLFARNVDYSTYNRIGYPAACT